MAGTWIGWRGEVVTGPETGTRGKGADGRPRKIVRFSLKEVLRNGRSGDFDFEALGEQADLCEQLLRPGVYCEIEAVEHNRSYERVGRRGGSFTRRAVRKVRLIERPTWLAEVERIQEARSALSRVTKPSA